MITFDLSEHKHPHRHRHRHNVVAVLAAAAAAAAAVRRRHRSDISGSMQFCSHLNTTTQLNVTLSQTSNIAWSSRCEIELYRRIVRRHCVWRRS